MAPKLEIKFWCDANLISEQVDFVGAKLDRIGGALEKTGKGFSASITAPLAAAAALAVAAGDELAEAQAKIRTSTGKTGDDLQALVSVVRSITLASGAPIQGVAAVVSEFSRMLGLSGDPLREATTALVKVARSFDADMGSAAKSVAQLANAWKVGSDGIVPLIQSIVPVARQAQGGFDGVARALAQSAATMQPLGFSLEKTIGLLQSLVSAGVAVEPAMDGLKQAVAKLAQQGVPDIAAAFERQIAAIRSAPDAATAASLAVGLFGESGVRLADAIRRGAFSGAMTPLGRMPSTDSVLSFARAWERLRAQLSAALAPLGAAIIASFTKLQPAIESLIGLVTSAVAAFASAPQWVIDVAVYGAGLVASIGPALVAIGTVATPLVKLVGGAIKKLGLVPSIDLAFVSVDRAAKGAALSFGVIGGAMVGAVDAGPIATKAIGDSVRATPPIAAPVERIGTDWPKPPTLKPLPPVPRFTAHVTAPPINAPPKIMVVPDLGGGTQVGSVFGGGFDWQSGFKVPSFDWQRQFADAASRSSTIPASLPPAPQFAGPKPGQSLGDAYREFAGLMGEWYGRMSNMGALPIGPLMPGSWLDANRPEQWLARAAEADRLVRDSQDRTSFFRAQVEERDRLASQAAQERDFANQMAFRNPTIVTGGEVARAAQSAVADAIRSSSAQASKAFPVNPTAIRARQQLAELEKIRELDGPPSAIGGSARGPVGENDPGFLAFYRDSDAYQNGVPTSAYPDAPTTKAGALDWYNGAEMWASTPASERGAAQSGGPVGENDPGFIDFYRDSDAYQNGVPTSAYPDAPTTKAGALDWYNGAEMWASTPASERGAAQSGGPVDENDPGFIDFYRDSDAYQNGVPTSAYPGAPSTKAGALAWYNGSEMWRNRQPSVSGGGQSVAWPTGPVGENDPGFIDFWNSSDAYRNGVPTSSYPDAPKTKSGALAWYNNSQMWDYASSIAALSSWNPNAAQAVRDKASRLYGMPASGGGA